jgi:hypothetical protein
MAIIACAFLLTFGRNRKSHDDLSLNYFYLFLIVACSDDARPSCVDGMNEKDVIMTALMLTMSLEVSLRLWRLDAHNFDDRLSLDMSDTTDGVKDYLLTCPSVRNIVMRLNLRL